MNTRRQRQRGPEDRTTGVAPRRVEQWAGLAAIAWLLGLVVSIVLQAWPVTVLLVGIAAAVFGMIQILAYAD